MNPTPSPGPTLSKMRRVRVYTRLSHALRKHLLAYCAATGRSERAVIEDAVARYLANPAKDPSTSGPLDRLAQAIDADRRVRERQHRDVELLSEAFGRFLRIWTMVHAATFTQPATPEAAEGLAKQRAAGESLFKRFAANVADQFRPRSPLRPRPSGHRGQPVATRWPALTRLSATALTSPCWWSRHRRTDRGRVGPPSRSRAVCPPPSRFA